MICKFQNKIFCRSFLPELDQTDGVGLHSSSNGNISLRMGISHYSPDVTFFHQISNLIFVGPILQWLFPSSPSCSSVTKPIIIKYSHDSSIAINISYMVGKRTAPGFICRWQRQRHRHTQRQIQWQRQRQIFQEESLPVYKSWVILCSNRYI